MERLRCSSLPLFMKCAQSTRGDVNISEYYPEAALGTAVHALGAQLVVGEAPNLDAVQALYGVEPTELEFFLGRLRTAWAELAPPLGSQAVIVAERDLVGDPMVLERPLQPPIIEVLAEVVLGGTADVVILEGEGLHVRVIDWKTGRRDVDYREQLLGYCALAMEHTPDARHATAQVVWLRELDVETHGLSRRELPAWRDRLLKQAADTTYRPGPHCQFCPRRYSCRARADMQEASLALLAGVRPKQDLEGTGRSLAERPPEEQIALYKKAKDVLGMATQVIDEIRALVAEQGEISGGGLRLTMVNENRRTVIPERAWPVLEKFLSVDSLAAAVTVSITKAEDGAAANKPRGEGAAARRAFVAALEEAGAIRHGTTRKLTERRT